MWLVCLYTWPGSALYCLQKTPHAPPLSGNLQCCSKGVASACALELAQCLPSLPIEYNSALRTNSVTV